MYVYKVEESFYGSYESGYGPYFDSYAKAKQYARERGFTEEYRDNECDVHTVMRSPFYRKQMLVCGNFLLDVTDGWLRSERYYDEQMWSLCCDYISILKLEVL